jgi:hypothetical protein
MFMLCILNCDFIGAGRRLILRYISGNDSVMEVVGDWGKLADLFRGPH